MSEVVLIGGIADGRVMDVPPDFNFVDVLDEDDLSPATFRRQSADVPVERARITRYRRLNDTRFVPVIP